MSAPAAHWEHVYGTKGAAERSWSQDRPSVSARLLAPHVATGRSVVDVGAGASPLVVDLLAQGWSRVTLLDLSAHALGEAQELVGEREDVTCVVGDVLAWEPDGPVHAWHDRAVFHFLTEAEQRARYAALAARAVVPDGHVVVGTFAPDGPERCSDLPTARYDAAGLAAALGPAFELVHDEREEHVTPWGAMQPFTWVVLRRR